MARESWWHVPLKIVFSPQHRAWELLHGIEFAGRH
jgi:hypothetical protein